MYICTLQKWCALIQIWLLFLWNFPTELSLWMWIVKWIGLDKVVLSQSMKPIVFRVYFMSLVLSCLLTCYTPAYGFFVTGCWKSRSPQCYQTQQLHNLAQFTHRLCILMHWRSCLTLTIFLSLPSFFSTQSVISWDIFSICVIIGCIMYRIYPNRSPGVYFL